MVDRLLLLFPKIDVDPVDGYVSVHELTEWNLNQAEREVMHRTQRELDVHDKNHDGFISFAEYEPPSWVQNSGPCLSLVSSLKSNQTCLFNFMEFDMLIFFFKDYVLLLPVLF